MIHINFYQPAVHGFSFNPNGAVLPCPWDLSKAIILSTNYEIDPGMIYYDTHELTLNLLKAMQAVRGYNKPKLAEVADIVITEKEIMHSYLKNAVDAITWSALLTGVGGLAKAGAKGILLKILRRFAF